MYIIQKEEYTKKLLYIQTNMYTLNPPIQKRKEFYLNE